MHTATTTHKQGSHTPALRQSGTKQFTHTPGRPPHLSPNSPQPGTTQKQLSTLSSIWLATTRTLGKRLQMRCTPSGAAMMHNRMTLSSRTPRASSTCGHARTSQQTDTEERARRAPSRHTSASFWTHDSPHTCMTKDVRRTGTETRDDVTVCHANAAGMVADGCKHRHPCPHLDGCVSTVAC